MVQSAVRACNPLIQDTREPVNCFFDHVMVWIFDISILVMKIFKPNLCKDHKLSLDGYDINRKQVCQCLKIMILM